MRITHVMASHSVEDGRPILVGTVYTLSCTFVTSYQPPPALLSCSRRSLLHVLVIEHYQWPMYAAATQTKPLAEQDQVPGQPPDACEQLGASPTRGSWPSHAAG